MSSNQCVKDFNADFEVSKENREVVCIVSTDAIDRDGEILLPSGLRKKNYGGNPVVLKNHDRSSLPVGKCLWLKQSGNQIIAKVQLSKKTKEADEVYGLIEDDMLRGVSIGFIPLKYMKRGDKGWKDEYSKATAVISEFEIFEFSFVSVPCNPECLVISKSISEPTTKIAAPEIPMPKYSISLEQKVAQALKRFNAEEILKRYKGSL